MTRPAMELVRPLEDVSERSPLAEARLSRHLTVDEAAKRAGLSPDEASWLEEGRVYRFPSSDAALLACVLYASGLEIDRREARELAGLPVPPRPVPQVNPVARVIGAAAIATLLTTLLLTVLIPGLLGGGGTSTVQAQPSGPPLPPPWKVKVDVLNGSGDINWTRRVASLIGGMAYQIERVGKADRFDYPQTAVYYEPGGREIGVRLARQLGVTTKPLPGGKNPRRLVVIVGPATGPG